MSENKDTPSKTMLGRLFRFPKRPNRLVVDADLVQSFSTAIEQHDTKTGNMRRQLRVAILGLVTLGALLLGIMITLNDALERMQAPDFVLKVSQAQRMIVLGPYYTALHEPQPGERIIPPQHEWNR